MNYIRYHETEKLITLYPLLKSLLQSLHADLDTLKKQTDINESIYSLCVSKHGELSGAPPVGKISDITGNIATRYKRSTELTKKELLGDILIISSIIDKIDIGLNSLMRLQRTIIELYYWVDEDTGEGKTWSDVIKILNKNNIYIGISNAKKLREKGIEQMTNIMKLPIETYNWTIDMIKV